MSVAAPATLRPADLAEARSAILRTSGVLRFVGAGTKQDWGAPGTPPDVVIETGGLDRLLEHSAGDMIAVVQPGLALADLQRALGEHGQRLALDPPFPQATLGGAFATNDAGPLRHRYGTVRDLAIGVTAVLSDGTVAHAGGRVVKNVAGFDLVRLLCGSFGTLGLVAELVVRLHPLPEAARIVRIPADPAAATRLALDLAATPLEPVAVEWHRGALLVRFEGRPAGLAAQVDGLRALAGPGVEEVDEQAWAAAAAAAVGEPGETVARGTTRPDGLAAAADALQGPAADAGVEAELTSSAGVGVHTARLRGGDAAGHAAVVRAWRRALVALGGAVVLRRRAAGVDGLVDPWFDEPDQAPSALAVMRRVKAQLDPAGRCAPGRYVGGI